MEILQKKILGKNIAKIRTKVGLKQEEVVTKLQLLGSPLSCDGYANIETGRANIFDSDLVALQQIFNVDFAEFFEGIPTSRKLQHRGRKKEE